MLKLEDVVDVRLLDAVPHRLKIEVEAVAGPDPRRHVSRVDLVVERQGAG